MPTGVKAYEKYKVSMKYAETEARVVFGISQLARQGLDIDSLDTIIFHLPIKDVEQPIGRILRVAAGKRSALALFLVDEHKIAEAMLKKAAETCQANASPARRHTYTQVLAKLAE